MADTAGSAGEVRVRLTLDASDLKQQITKAEARVGSGEGINLTAKLDIEKSATAVGGQLGSLGKAVREKGSILLKGGLHKENTVAQINEDIDSISGRTSHGIKQIVIPVKLKMSRDDRAALRTIRDQAASEARQKGGSEGATSEKREMGGHVQPGRVYEVGERGREYVMFGQQGTVIPTRNIPKPPQYHKGGWAIAGHRHSDDGSMYKDPRSGQWYPTIVRTPEDARIHREMGASRHEGKGTPWKATIQRPSLKERRQGYMDRPDPRIDPRGVRENDPVYGAGYSAPDPQLAAASRGQYELTEKIVAQGAVDPDPNTAERLQGPFPRERLIIPPGVAKRPGVKNTRAYAPSAAAIRGLEESSVVTRTRSGRKVIRSPMLAQIAMARELEYTDRLLPEDAAASSALYGERKARANAAEHEAEQKARKDRLELERMIAEEQRDALVAGSEDLAPLTGPPSQRWKRRRIRPRRGPRINAGDDTEQHVGRTYGRFDPNMPEGQLELGAGMGIQGLSRPLMTYPGVGPGEDPGHVSGRPLPGRVDKTGKRNYRLVEPEAGQWSPGSGGPQRGVVPSQGEFQPFQMFLSAHPERQDPRIGMRSDIRPEDPTAAIMAARAIVRAAEGPRSRTVTVSGQRITKDAPANQLSQEQFDALKGLITNERGPRFQPIVYGNVEPVSKAQLDDEAKSGEVEPREWHDQARATRKKQGFSPYGEWDETRGRWTGYPSSRYIPPYEHHGHAVGRLTVPSKPPRRPRSAEDIERDQEYQNRLLRRRGVRVGRYGSSEGDFGDDLTPAEIAERDEKRILGMERSKYLLGQLEEFKQGLRMDDPESRAILDVFAPTMTSNAITPIVGDVIGPYSTRDRRDEQALYRHPKTKVDPHEQKDEASEIPDISPRKRRRLLNARRTKAGVKGIVPGLGTLYGAQARAFERISRLPSDPTTIIQSSFPGVDETTVEDEAMRELDKVNRLQQQMVRKWHKVYGEPGSKLPQWTELGPQQRKLLARSYGLIEDLTEEADQDEAELMYKERQLRRQRGIVSKPSRKQRALKKTNVSLRDPLGAFQTNLDLDAPVLGIAEVTDSPKFREFAAPFAKRISAVDAQIARAKLAGDDEKVATFQETRAKILEEAMDASPTLRRYAEETTDPAERIRREGIIGEMLFADTIPAEYDEEGNLVSEERPRYSQPDVGAMLLRTSMSEFRTTRRVAATEIRLQALEKKIEAAENRVYVAENGEWPSEAVQKKEIEAAKKERSQLKAERAAAKEQLTQTYQPSLRASGGPLMARLQSARAGNAIQEAYDAGDYSRGQMLQKQAEDIRAKQGTGGPSQRFREMLAEKEDEELSSDAKTVSPWVDRMARGLGVGKVFAGGGVKRALSRLFGSRQLARGYASGDMPDLAAHPGAALMGERGPEMVFGADGSVEEVGRHGAEVVVPTQDVVVAGNHWDGDPSTIPGISRPVMRHDVMANWPKGQPMSPWVRKAAANKLYAKETYAGGGLMGRIGMPAHQILLEDMQRKAAEKKQKEMAEPEWLRRSKQLGIGKDLTRYARGGKWSPEHGDIRRNVSGRIINQAGQYVRMSDEEYESLPVTERGVGILNRALRQNPALGQTSHGQHISGRIRPQTDPTAFGYVPPQSQRVIGPVTPDPEQLTMGNVPLQHGPEYDPIGLHYPIDPARRGIVARRARGIGGSPVAIPLGVPGAPIQQGVSPQQFGGQAFQNQLNNWMSPPPNANQQAQQQGQQQGQQWFQAWHQGWNNAGVHAQQQAQQQGQQQGQQQQQQNQQQQNQQQQQQGQQGQPGIGTPPPGGPVGAAGRGAAARAQRAGSMSAQQQQSLLGGLGLGGGGTFSGEDYANAIAGIRTGVSEQLSLTPVRALSVSIGQIFQQLGGRAQIQARAAKANLASAEAQKESNFLNRIRDERSGLEYEIRTRQNDQQFIQGTGKDSKTAYEQRIAQLDIAEQTQEPVVQSAIARASEAEKGVSTATQRFGLQALGLGGIVTGTVIFSKAMEIVSGGMAALADVTDKATDQLSGFTRTANTAADQMSQLMIGGTGGAAEFAAAQARIGFSGETPELQRRAQLIAGATNFQTIRDQLRAERNFSERDRDQGVFTGFNNGPLAGTPIVGDWLGWIGQQQSMSELLASPGQREGAYSGNASITGMMPQDVADAAGLEGYFNPINLRIAGLLESNGQFNENATVQDFVDTISRTGLKQYQNLDVEAISKAVAESSVAPQQTTQTESQVAQLNEVKALWGEIDDNQKKLNKNLGSFIVDEENAYSPQSRATAQTFRDKGLDKLADQIEQFGVAFVDTQGNFVDDVERAMQNAATGGTFQDPAAILESMRPALEARVRGMQRRAEYQTSTQIPVQYAQQFITNPSISTTGMQGISAPGLLTGGLPAGLSDYGDQIDDINAQVQDFVDGGLKKMHDELGIPQGTIDEIQGYGDEIRRLGELSESLQLGLDQDRYTEQLFLQRRALGDIVGLVGQSSASYKVIADVNEKGVAATEQQVIQATKLGVLQRAQIQDQREMARLSRLQQLDQRELARISLARSQRELNLQLALSRLQAPGETPQERAVRRREAELIANEKQRELDINKRTTERGFGIEDIGYRTQQRGFTIEDIGFRRQLRDALKQAGLSESERQVSLELRGIGKLKSANEVLLQTKTGFLAVGITLADQVTEGVMSAQETLETQSGQFLDTFEGEVRKMFRPIKEQIRETLSIGSDHDNTGLDRSANQGRTTRKGGRAAGGIFDAKGATNFIAGEAGSEQVVVLRNPRLGMTSGGMASGGGGGNTVNISIAINNPSVRSDGDIERLVEKVKRAIHDEAEVVGVG